jgi:hypothetical protein
MRDLAVLIPTRGRPENIRKVIAAWDFTNAWDHADMVLVADSDDPEIGSYRSAITSSDHRRSLSLGDVTLIEVPKWMPMVHKLNRVAVNLAGQRTYRALGFAGDDHLPQTINWARRYLAVLDELGTGMVFGDDGYQGQNLSTEWAVTADAVRALGRMVPADVEHMYCDNSIMELFAEAGALRYLPEVRIEHMHPIVGKAKTDAQYQRVNHRDQFRKDRRAYEGWRHGDVFRTDVAAIRHLRQGRPEVRPARETRQISPGSVPRRVPQRPRGGSVSRTFPFPRHFKNIRGATPDAIGVALADFASAVPADQEIVELGVFQGRSALMMAWGSRQGHGAHLTGVDAWDLPGNTYGPPFTDEGSRRWAAHWVQALGYSGRISLVQGFATDIAEHWVTTPDLIGYGNKPVGLLFVDDDHSYAGARGAIESWAPHLAPGARIAVDDYGHPDWPGVKEAVDALVAEGFLAPIEVFHDRLAVTRLVDDQDGVAGRTLPRREDGTIGDPPITSITSEGAEWGPLPEITPSPYPSVGDQVAVPPAEGNPLVPFVATESPVLQPSPGGQADSEVSIDRTKMTLTEAIEIEVMQGLPSTASITDMNLVQLKALAKHRGIVLGARKDKRDLILGALRSGR